LLALIFGGNERASLIGSPNKSFSVGLRRSATVDF
jgi:hypothetical protein